MTPRLLPLLLLGTLLRGDALADLKGALAHLGGRGPVRARVDYRFWNRQGDDKKPVITEGRAEAQVEDGPQGLRMSWGHDLIRRAAREAQEQVRDPEAKAPTQLALEGLKATTVLACLNAAEDLSGLLGQAQLIETREEAWQGKPARRLRLKVSPKLSGQGRKYIREFEATADVWVGPDGLPLAAETDVHLKGRALLVISFEQQERETFHYVRTGNRLVVIHHTKESQGSGGGEHGQRKTVVDLALE